MKSSNLMVSLLVLVAVVAGMAPAARAELVLQSYNFELPAVAVGQLRGQDNWVAGHAVYSACDVFTPASGDNTTQVVRALSTAGSTVCDVRQSPTMTFTSADTAIALRFWVYSGNVSGGVYGGLGWAVSTAAPPLPNMGRVLSGGAMMTYFRSGAPGHTEYFGTALSTGKWYELQGVMNFATNKFSMYYRNITDGEKDFTPDANLSNIAMSLASNGQGQFVANGYTIRIDRGTQVGGQYVQYIDNFRVVDLNAVPEPSTLALLAGGLIGRLAYAWRKRK